MTLSPFFHGLACSLLALTAQALAWQPSGETVPPAPQEFRAAWISTVHNIDWPSRSGLSGAAQRSELLNILNTCAQLKLNAVFLQVRPNADALYRSFLEPWSQWLSGPGVNPGYDPLAFAIQEAHRRGIELHAWFNPFRAKANVNHAVGRNHISLTRPDLMKRSGSVLLMNPSASASRDHAMKVILDVVRRYDIDGVHLDDYFYPYPAPGRSWTPGSFGDGKSPSQRRAYIDDFAPYSHLCFFLLQFLSVVLAPIPSNITAAAGGVLFGTWPSFFLTFAAVVAGSLLLFWLARVLGRDFAGRFVSRRLSEKYQQILQTKAPVFLTLAFLFPFFPDDLLCILAGLSSLSFRRFAVIVLLARPWGLLFASALGGASFSIPVWGMALIGVAGAALFLLGMKYGDRVEASILRALRRDDL